MKIFMISKEGNKEKHGSAETHNFQVIQSMTKKGRFLIQLGKKSALLNRAGNQLRTVPYPV